MSLKARVHRNLLKILLVYLALFAVVALLVRYDLTAKTPWILNTILSQVLGWLAALYGLFWIVWWWFWIAIEGGDTPIDLYGVTWAPVASDLPIGGPYEWCRYPLVFGCLEFVWGAGFLVQSTTTVLKAVPAAAVASYLVLRLYVDRRRLERHGDVYRSYRKDTPLLIPRIPSSAAILHVFRRRRRR